MLYFIIVEITHNTFNNIMFSLFIIIIIFERSTQYTRTSAQVAGGVVHSAADQSLKT